MKACDNYSCIEFNGLSLNPSFSIYLFEIIKDEKDRFFYVGMTGDNHYPSARSILHRLAGHISLVKSSTQSQLINGIKMKVFNKEEIQDHLSAEELQGLKIKLHYWPIEGFVRWNYSLKDFKRGNLSEEDKKLYNSYKEKQSIISKLEKYLIGYLQDNMSEEKCLNKTDEELKSAYKSEKGIEELNSSYNHIFDKVNTIIQ